MQQFHHYHVVSTGVGAVLPDDIAGVKHQSDAKALVDAGRAVTRIGLAPGERIISDRNKLGFVVETDTVGRYCYFVYTEGCNDPRCDLVADFTN